MNHKMHYLSPIITSNIKNFLSYYNAHNLVSTFGSPLNIVFPEQIEANAENFKEIFQKHHLKGDIYYAAKANKSISLMKGALKAGIKIDVASVKELKDALSVGFTGERIEATGPKNNEFLTLCLYHNVLINLDDLNELNDILELKSKLALSNPTNILIRLNDFSSDQVKILRNDSRFGIKSSDIEKIYTILLNTEAKINLKGFSFHLPTTSSKERLIAIENIIELFFESIKRGFEPNIIDIGGGFSINYLESKAQWNEYLGALKASVINNNEVMTWNEQGLGFWGDKGTLKGTQSFPDFYREKNQFEELDELLASESSKYGTSIGSLISENGWILSIEPGRSLLDQAGITMATVINNKHSLKGENLIIVDMNRSNLNSQDIEFMSDPIVIQSAENKKSSNTESAGFIAGNLCLPYDFINKRKVYFKLTPLKGDLLVFCNTAGYSMDFAESNTLRQNIAKKIAIRSYLGEIELFEDEKYPYL